MKNPITLITTLNLQNIKKILRQYRSKLQVFNKNIIKINYIIRFIYIVVLGKV